VIQPNVFYMGTVNDVDPGSVRLNRTVISSMEL